MSGRLITCIILITGSCNPAVNNIDPVVSDSIPEETEQPANADTIIPTAHFAEFLESKYTSDPVQQLELQTKFKAEEHDSVKTSSVQLNGLSIGSSSAFFFPHLLIVEVHDPKAIDAFVKKELESLTGNSEKELKLKALRYFDWEWDNYYKCINFI
jgi:hypothetical protein